MRGGRDLRVDDFRKKEDYFNLLHLMNVEGMRRRTKNYFDKLKSLNDEGRQKIKRENGEKSNKIVNKLMYHYRIEGYGFFKIPYIFFGDIPIVINNKGYTPFYKYVIYNTNNDGGDVLISQVNSSGNDVEPVNFNENNTDLYDKLRELYNELKKNPNNYKRIQKFIKVKLNIRNGNGNDPAQGNVRENSPAQGNVRENSPAQGNVRGNGPDEVSEQIKLSNGCIKYPANYHFSGKINGKPYNTNKLFRGNNRQPRSLYSYDPRKGKYELLLTELDYLVNANDPPSITYSGLFQLSDQSVPLLINAGDTKISITDIDHYLYCLNPANFPSKTYSKGPIYIQ
jgi:hypothetical protein